MSAISILLRQEVRVQRKGFCGTVPSASATLFSYISSPSIYCMLANAVPFGLFMLHPRWRWHDWRNTSRSFHVAVVSTNIHFESLRVLPCRAYRSSVSPIWPGRRRLTSSREMPIAASSSSARRCDRFELAPPSRDPSSKRATVGAPTGAFPPNKC